VRLELPGREVKLLPKTPGATEGRRLGDSGCRWLFIHFFILKRERERERESERERERESLKVREP
jgi:hypothetical protein